MNSDSSVKNVIWDRKKKRTKKDLSAFIVLILIIHLLFSLQDILKKEEIKLDWNFKWSMLNDLVRVC